jgi:hypothetical protein
VEEERSSVSGGWGGGGELRHRRVVWRRRGASSSMGGVEERSSVASGWCEGEDRIPPMELMGQIEVVEEVVVARWRARWWRSAGERGGGGAPACVVGRGDAATGGEASAGQARLSGNQEVRLTRCMGLWKLAWRPLQATKQAQTALCKPGQV